MEFERTGIKSLRTFYWAFAGPIGILVMREALTALKGMLVSCDRINTWSSTIVDNFVAQHCLCTSHVFRRSWFPGQGWHLCLKRWCIFYACSSEVGEREWCIYSVFGRDALMREIFGTTARSIVYVFNERESVITNFKTERAWQTETIDHAMEIILKPESMCRCAVLIVGTPGVGKTETGLLLATRMRLLSPPLDPIVHGGFNLKEGYNPRFPAARTVPVIIGMDEIDEQFNCETEDRPLNFKMRFNQNMDNPTPNTIVVATSNRPLGHFPDWFLRRFHVWVEVVAAADGFRHAIHTQTAHGVLSPDLLYTNE